MSSKPLTKEDIDYVSDYDLADKGTYHPRVEVKVVLVKNVLSALKLLEQKIDFEIMKWNTLDRRDLCIVWQETRNKINECFPVLQSSDVLSRENKNCKGLLASGKSGDTQNQKKEVSFEHGVEDGEESRSRNLVITTRGFQSDSDNVIVAGSNPANPAQNILPTKKEFQAKESLKKDGVGESDVAMRTTSASTQHSFTVEFKSSNSYFLKQKSGIKNNTVRKIDNNDVRFHMLQLKKATHIKIINVDFPKQNFIREINDYSEFDGWAIITWKHSEQNKKGND